MDKYYCHLQIVPKKPYVRQVMVASRIIVTSKSGLQVFSAIFHTPVAPEEFHMDPTEFYLEWGKSIPAIPHHEIEITSPEDNFLRQHGLHIHASRKTGKPFICYPKRMETTSEALRVFRTWCLGSVATIVEEIDLNTIHSQECGGDAEKMERVLHERYGIFVATQVVSVQ
ncbi:MAG: hypothetical protein AAB534_01980 [Patescibacteria group bacterium]